MAASAACAAARASASASAYASASSAASSAYEFSNSASKESVPMISLVGHDQIEVSVRRDAAEMSVLIKELLDDLGQDAAMGAIPLQNLDSETIKRVFEFCAFHCDNKGVELPDWNAPWPESRHLWLNPDGTWKYRKEWERIDGKWTRVLADLDEYSDKFINDLSMDNLRKVTYASNYLNVEVLLKASGKRIAEMIKGKSVEEMRELFNIKNDYTPEEYAEVEKEFEWLFKA